MAISQCFGRRKVIHYQKYDNNFSSTEMKEGAVFFYVLEEHALLL